MGKIEIIQGDITTLKNEAIVNAANESLLGGGGVDGAIHRAAGPELREYNKTIGGCKTGEAKLSPGFKLPASYVISTVGPVWKGGNNNEESLLASCYTQSLKLASEKELKTIAFPAISTGIYGFPFERATSIALSTIKDFLSNTRVPEVVTLVFFTAEQKVLAEKLYKKINNS